MGNGGRREVMRGEISVVQSHKRKPTTKRKPLKGGRRGKWKGLEEGDREKMASLLRNWIRPRNAGLSED